MFFSLYGQKSSHRHNTQLVNWNSSLISLSCSLVNILCSLLFETEEHNKWPHQICWKKPNLLCIRSQQFKNEMKSSKQISPQIFSSITNQYQFAKWNMQAIWNYQVSTYVNDLVICWKGYRGGPQIARKVVPKVLRAIRKCAV